jgi:NTE family protein
MADGGKGRGSEPRIGLALGGGGARGLAHIPVIEALDELGIRPAVIAGTSIGAIVGAIYASGMSGREMHAFAVARFRNRSEVLARLWALRPKRVRDIFAQGTLTIGQFNAERILEAFLPDSLPATFDELSIPLKLIATDFYGWRETVIEHGPLMRAIAASSALPVLFRPVGVGDAVMIDGGISNPLPFDRAAEESDIVIAVDVTGGPLRGHRRVPGSTEAMFGASQLFMRAITNEKLKSGRPPDILLHAPANGYRALDFMKAAAIIKDAEPLKDTLKHMLERALAG